MTLTMTFDLWVVLNQWVTPCNVTMPTLVQIHPSKPKFCDESWKLSANKHEIEGFCLQVQDFFQACLQHFACHFATGGSWNFIYGSNSRGLSLLTTSDPHGATGPILGAREPLNQVLRFFWRGVYKVLVHGVMSGHHLTSRHDVTPSCEVTKWRHLGERT